MLKKSIPLLGVSLLATLLLIYPQDSSSAAIEGLLISFRLIIPSLFPFFVISSLLISLGFGDILGKIFSKFMPLFGLSGICATPIILGALGGYPTGLRIATQLKEEKLCSPEELRRVCLFCNNCGPGFLFSVAGWGIFSSKLAGIILLLTHMLSALILGLILGLFKKTKDTSPQKTLQKQKKEKFSVLFPQSIKDAFATTLNICAFVVFFTIVLRLSSSCGLLPHLEGLISKCIPGDTVAPLIHSFLTGLLELSTGVYSLTEASGSTLALPLAAFIMAWGGLSVHCQSLPFLESCNAHLPSYFLAKFLQGILAALLVLATLPFLPQVIVPSPATLSTIFLQSPKLLLLQEEILALWLLSGLYFFYHRKKAGKK